MPKCHRNRFCRFVQCRPYHQTGFTHRTSTPVQSGHPYKVAFHLFIYIRNVIPFARKRRMDTGQYKTTAAHLRISGISAFYLSYLRIPPFCGQATGFHRTSLHGRRKRTTSRLIERSHTIVVPLPRLYPEIGITVQHLFFINGDVFKIILTALRTLNYVSIGRESRRRLPFEKDLPYRGVRLQPFRHSRDRQRRINGGLQGKRQRTISEMILTAMFRTQQFRHTLTIRCRNAFQYLIMIINQLPHRPFAQNSQGINGGPTVVHLLAVVVISKGHTSHLVMTCHIFRPS